MPLDVSRPDLSLAVVGTGVMGRGIAQIAAQAGIRALLHDSRPGAAREAKESVSAQLARLAEKGRLEREALARAQANLVIADSREALASCPIVIEAIVENLDAKRELFRSLEDIVSGDCLMASNTSSFSITAIAAACKGPERIAGFHFFNPVPLMKVVEVVDGLFRSPWVGEALAALALRCGHKPVRAKDTPGFIVNHAGRGYGTEALRILGDALPENAQRLGAVAAARVVADEPRRVLRAHRLVPAAQRQRRERLADPWSSQQAVDDLDNFHQRHRIEEMKSGDALGPP